MGPIYFGIPQTCHPTCESLFPSPNPSISGAASLVRQGHLKYLQLTAASRLCPAALIGDLAKPDRRRNATATHYLKPPFSSLFLVLPPFQVHQINQLSNPAPKGAH